MLTLSCVLAALLLAVASVEGQAPCRSANGEAGQCIPFYDCKPLMDIVKKRNRTYEESDLLMRSTCRTVNKIITFCCPVQSIPNPRNNCITPEGSHGRCININSCGHISELLTTSIQQQTIDYVKKTKCTSSDPYSVCCDSTPAEDRLPFHRNKCVTSTSHIPPDPTSGCCGRDAHVGDKIVGGDPTSIDMYPWLALIEYFIDNYVMRTLCGGSLISSRYVLTAAHCVVGEVEAHGKPRHVRLGEYDQDNEGPDCVPTAGNGTECTNGVLRIGIEKVITHTQYDGTSTARQNDIALIRLNAAAPFSDFIRPICLPTTDIFASPPPNLDLFAAGWGSTLRGTTRRQRSPVKMFVQLPYVDRNRCNAIFSSINFGDGQICAGGEEGKDACRGDSGGPLMYQKGRTFELVGVVSYGPVYCGTKDRPGVYTKVFQYKEWINNNIEP